MLRATLLRESSLSCDVRSMQREWHNDVECTIGRYSSNLKLRAEERFRNDRKSVRPSSIEEEEQKNNASHHHLLRHTNSLSQKKYS